MAIDFATVDPGILTLVAQLSGCPQSVWFDQQRPAVVTAIALLSHVSTSEHTSGINSRYLPVDPIVLPGTVTLVNGQTGIILSAPPDPAIAIEADGGILTFDSQPGTGYGFTADITGTTGTLATPYTGTSTTSARATFTSDLLHENLEEVDYFTVRVRVEVYDQRYGKTAKSYLEAMRTRWWRTRTSIALQALGVGYVSMGATQDLSETRDGHRVSIASADLTFLALTTDIDPHGDPPINSLDPTTANLS